MPTTLRIGSSRVHTRSLCDSGASSSAFIDETFARKSGIEILTLQHPRILEAFDGSPSGAGSLTHFVESTMVIKNHVEKLALYVTHLRHHPIILGHPWLSSYNPYIDWKKNAVTFASEYCLRNCQTSPTHVQGSSYEDEKEPADEGYESSSSKPDLSPSRSSPSYRSPSSRRTSTERRTAQERRATPLSQPPVRLDCVMVGAETFANLAVSPGVELFECSIRDLDRALGTSMKEQNPSTAAPPVIRNPVYRTNPALSPEENQRAKEVHDMEVQLKIAVSAEDLEAYRKSKDIDPKLLLPPRYHDHLRVFQRSKSNELPPHRPYDHAIDLIPGKEPPYGPLYSMTREENEELRRKLNTQLSKGFIRSSRSEAASPVLFIKKPGGGLRFYVDYRGLNEITIKNRYPLPLITETLARLSSARIYTKLDIISAFNRLRIKDGDEWKTAFRTRFGLFEYLVMPFGLCNGPASFQHYINDTLRDYLDVFYTAYLDDILIYSLNEAEHEIHIKRILTRLQDAGLQVDITKCEFHVTEVAYLGLIVTT